MNLNTRNLLIASGIAGVVMALLSSIPFVNLVNCLLCGWIWVGGAFSVWLYRRQSGAPSVSIGQGAVVGLAAGLVGAVVASLIGLITGSTSGVLDAIRSNGAAVDALGPLLAAGAFSIVGFLINIVFYLGFGAVGGLIGAAIFGKAQGTPA